MDRHPPVQNTFEPMDKKQQNINRLRWLAGITAAALLGIIALQVYWLSTSYAEQQSRFKADVESALTSTIIKTQLAAELTGIADRPAAAQMEEGLTDLLNTFIARAPKQRRINNRSGLIKSITIEEKDSLSLRLATFHKLMADSAACGKDTEKVVLDVGRMTQADTAAPVIDLASVKTRLIAQLRKRDI